MRTEKKRGRGHAWHIGAHVWTCAGEAWKCTGLVRLAETGPVCLSTYVSTHITGVRLRGWGQMFCCAVATGDVLMMVIAKSKGLG